MNPFDFFAAFRFYRRAGWTIKNAVTEAFKRSRFVR